LILFHKDVELKQLKIRLFAILVLPEKVDELGFFPLISFSVGDRDSDM